MQVNRNGTSVSAKLDGPIGDSSPLFILPLARVKELNVDMKDVSWINSVGVRSWILWTMRIPADCMVNLETCPLMFARQACTVKGFVNDRIRIKSIVAPYTCEGCGNEQTRLLVCGQDYDYARGATPAKINFPQELPCPKCNGKMEPDFHTDTTLGFLNGSVQKSA